MQDRWVPHHHKYQPQVEDHLPICQYDVQQRNGHTGNRSVLLSLRTERALWFHTATDQVSWLSRLPKLLTPTSRGREFEKSASGIRGLSIHAQKTRWQATFWWQPDGCEDGRSCFHMMHSNRPVIVAEPFRAPRKLPHTLRLLQCRHRAPQQQQQQTLVFYIFPLLSSHPKLRHHVSAESSPHNCLLGWFRCANRTRICTRLPSCKSSYHERVSFLAHFAPYSMLVAN